MNATLEIETLTSWSEPKEISTRLGKKLLRKGLATETFWNAWRAGKDALKTAGVSCGKDARTGAWEACWWLPLDAATVEKQEVAVEASKSAEAPLDFAIPAPAGLDYLPFQKAGIALMSTRENNLLGDEMGLGKTVQAIGIVNADPSCKRVLVVCPASLKRNWERELSRWLVRPLKVAIQVAGTPWVGELADVVIVNYDIVDKFGKCIAAVAWDLLVADECHYLKNPKAKRTAAVLGKRAKKDGTGGHPGIVAKRRVFMSGTPVVNRPVELFPILNALQPGKWGFRQMIRYCDGKQTRWGWDFSGASHLDELQRELRATLMVRRLKNDVLTDLPAKRRQVIELPDDGLEELVANEKAQYERNEAALIELRARVAAAELADDDAQYSELAEKLAKASMVAFDEMSKVRHEISIAKLPMVIEHVRSILDSGVDKVVVFGHHRDVVEAIAKEFGYAQSNRKTVQQVDSSKEALNQGELCGETHHVVMPVCLRKNETSARAELDDRNIKGMSGVQAEKTRAVLHARIQNDGASEIAGKKTWNSIQSESDRHQNSKSLSLVGDTNQGQQPKIQREQSVIGSDKPKQGVLGGECVGNKLESKCDKTQRIASRASVTGRESSEKDEYAVILYGGMADEEKDAAVQAFQNDPNCRVFVGGIKAAGVGLTLTASSHVVFAELDWVPGVVSQAEDRCHRIGQTESVLIQHLVLEGSLDARMVKVIVQKQNVIDRALDKGALKLEAKLPVLQVTIGSVLDPAACGEPLPVSGTSDGGDVRAAAVVPVASEQLRELVHSGLKALAGCDTDWASEVNGVGFNKFDGAFGHALAERSRLTDKMVAAGIRLCTKYRKQLGEGFTAQLKQLQNL